MLYISNPQHVLHLLFHVVSFLCYIFQVLEAYKGENDKLKLLVLFCGEEDELLVRAAAGALAMLSEDEIICQKIPNVCIRTLIYNNNAVFKSTLSLCFLAYGILQVGKK